MTTTQTKHIIDLDASPVIPAHFKNWRIRPKDQPSNVVRGKFEWDPAKVRLYVTPGQEQGQILSPRRFTEELDGELLFNATLLDYLLDHPEIIPEERKRDKYGRTRYIFFFGTYYDDPYGDLYVRGLCCEFQQWGGCSRWLGKSWDNTYPVAVLTT
jgi:hypothetical protein